MEDIMKPFERYKIPLDIEEKIRKYRLEGAIELQNGNPKLAKAFFEKQYQTLIEAQKREKRTLHKGDALYNLGLAFLYMEDYNNAIKNFLLAYIEDTLSSEFDYEDNADRAPAAQMLRDVFIIDLRFLREIKTAVRLSKSDEPEKPIQNHEKILEIVEGVLDIFLEKLTLLAKRLPKMEKPVVGFPQPRELRVFIGTNYDVNIGIIPLVKDGIQRKNQTDNTNYTAVAVLDLNVPPDSIHDVCLTLLHTCNYAIIDVGHPGGQFVEIERIRDYGIPDKNVLLLRQSAKDPSHTPHVSGMIATLGYRLEYYYDPREIIALTQEFLP